MADQGADVRSLQVLSDLRAGLGRFAGEAREALSATALEIQRTQDWLRERALYWIRVVEQCRAAVAAARQALQVCQSACARERAQDSRSRCSCTAEQQALMRAEAALREAEGKLALVRHWQARVNQAAAAYQAQARRLAELAGPRAEQARAFLSARQAELERYLSVGLGAAIGGALSASDSASIPTDLFTAQHAPAIQMVSVSQVDMEEIEHVNSPKDFHKVAYTDMVEGFQKLKDVVLPAVAQGADGDYFRALDQQQGVDYAYGYQRIYEAFYGQDAIRLERDGEHYRIINGAHRLYVARQLGIEYVPARIARE